MVLFFHFGRLPFCFSKFHYGVCVLCWCFLVNVLLIAYFFSLYSSKKNTLQWQCMSVTFSLKSVCRRKIFTLKKNRASKRQSVWIFFFNFFLAQTKPSIIALPLVHWPSLEIFVDKFWYYVFTCVFLDVSKTLSIKHV